MKSRVEALIALLAGGFGGALLFIAINAIRDVAIGVKCRGNLRLIGLCLHNYQDSMGQFPKATEAQRHLPPEERLGWSVALLPYVEGGNTYSQFAIESGWNCDENRIWALTPLPFLACQGYPERQPTTTLVPTHYLGIAGIGEDAAALAKDDARAGCFGYDRVLRLDDLGKGTSTTLMLLETSRASGSWTAGGHSTVRGLKPEEKSYLGLDREFGGNHPGSANAVFADGSVRLLKDSLAPEILEAIATIKGGREAERVGDDP
jgi:prepilin-type processing-associated H-X9-DG protein